MEGSCLNEVRRDPCPLDVAVASAPVAQEPFVSADEAARFLCVKRRHLLELARRGIAGAYALGTGSAQQPAGFVADGDPRSTTLALGVRHSF